MTVMGRGVSGRDLLVALVVLAALAAAAVYGWDRYQRHQRQQALERLLQETCDECAARHESVRRLEESLKNGPQESPAAETP